jgi:hypothetical protein
MFMMKLANTVHIGDTAEVTINAKPARVTWRDAQTLVIEPGDARRIVHIQEDSDMRTFTCSDADGDNDFYIITERPEGTRISRRRRSN